MIAKVYARKMTVDSQSRFRTGLAVNVTVRPKLTLAALLLREMFVPICGGHGEFNGWMAMAKAVDIWFRMQTVHPK
jgi:hypothetical protein